mgnify:FL=1
MSQSTWAAETATWTTDTYLWANDTHTGTATLAASNSTTLIGNTLYPSGIILTSSGDVEGSGGFQLVGYANFDLGTSTTSGANTIYVDSITINTDNGLISVGNLPYSDSITISSNLDIPQPGTLRWEEETETWETHTGSWGYVPSIAVPVTADLTQVNLSELHEEDAEKIASTVYALAAGATASGSVVVPVSATLSNEQDIKFNINYG